MTFVFLIFKNYIRGRVTRSSKIEGIKGIMGCPKQEGVSPVKEIGAQPKGRPTGGEN